MKTNKRPPSIYTHAGAKAQHIKPEQQLKRTVMSCLLWEDNFYESGQSVVDRIKELVPQVDPLKVVQIARQARDEMNLRHVPLLIVREMARHKTHRRYVSRTLQHIIQRPDEMTEFLAIYWKEGKCPLANKVKQGLAYSFQKFNEYQLAKYNRDAIVKLRDVLFISHSKPKDLPADPQRWTKNERKQNITRTNPLTEGEQLYKAVVDNTLKTPDTWEVALSGGANKKETFERLMSENKLGALAFLRNLRNMQEAQVDKGLVAEYGEKVDFKKVLPFRFIAAAIHNPFWESMIEKWMLKSLLTQPKIQGKTIILVDISGSMDEKLSQKSEMKRVDAACALAVIGKELMHQVEVFSFSNHLAQIIDRRGFALRDAIFHSQAHASTQLGQAMSAINSKFEYDRIIVITDEQSADSVPMPKNKGYMINVGTSKNGIGYGQWTHIDGFSEAIFKWIIEYEKGEQ